MRYLKRKTILGFLVALVVYFFGFYSKDFYTKLNQKISPTVQPKNVLLPKPKEGVYKVIKVLDGDTIVLETGEKFRYLGIDSPEWNDRWGPEAKKFNEEMTLNKKVKIELDQVKLDKYGRILGYIWVDNILVNEALVERGYAKVNLIKGEVKPKYLNRLQKAETWAKEHNDGLWFDNLTNE